MRTVNLALLLGALGAAALLCASCGDSTTPQKDTTAPQVDLTLSAYLTGDWCPALISFRANPMGSLDDETARDDLRIRWDFNGDGTWDTVFDAIALQDCIAVEPLPVGEWTVRCEVEDRAGNVSTHTQSLVLPEWVPVAPDIIAGALAVWMPPWADAPTDTVDANTEFSITLKNQDWLTACGQVLQVRFYVDGVLVDEQSESALPPRPFRCHCHLALVAGGIATPGRHEIRAVVDAADAIAESDEVNNIAVAEVFVRE